MFSIKIKLLRFIAIALFETKKFIQSITTCLISTYQFALGLLKIYVNNRMSTFRVQQQKKKQNLSLCIRLVQSCYHIVRGILALQSQLYIYQSEFSCTMTINFSWNFPFRSWNFFELHPPQCKPLSNTPGFGPWAFRKTKSPRWRTGMDCFSP